VSNDDQKNVDIILLTVGALIIVAVGIFILARDIGTANQARMQRNDPAIQAVVARRLQPVGSVVLDGEISADPEVTAVTEAAAAPVVLTGPQVYNQACIACHGGGIGGAPKTGDAAAWGPRIAQGMDVLNDHAINGYQGSAGVMPAKGGYIQLSDDEIIAAVQYLVDAAR
jgi:cytochrome c5